MVRSRGTHKILINILVVNAPTKRGKSDSKDETILRNYLPLHHCQHDEVLKAFRSQIARSIMREERLSRS